VKAVTFDFGQTLAELDHAFLQARLAERGASFDPGKAVAGTSAAWQMYGEKKSEGHASAWRAMIEMLLQAGEVEASRLAELAEWLWSEQPKQNLWRRPIPGMIELVRELRKSRVPVGIISNSEGRLAELVRELGWEQDIELVIDSGRLGIDKPDPRIFQHACAALGVAPTELVHVGDAWEADVQGALGAGAHAIWFDQRHTQRVMPPNAAGAGNAAEARAELVRLGLLRA
jgi:HAD superfamily hydrolase (TIGR01549 family)